MADKSKRYRLSDDSINSYGYSVLTSGINISRVKNGLVPALLNHSSDQPIGTWQKVMRRKGELIGTLELNEDLKDTKQAKALIDGPGTIGVSIGIGDVEFNDDYTQIVKSTLYEASITPTPSNGNAHELHVYKNYENREKYSEMELVKLRIDHATGATENVSLNHKKEIDMEKLEVAEGKIKELEAQIAELAKTNAELSIQVEDFKKAEVESYVDEAIKTGKFNAGSKESLLKLAHVDLSAVKELAKGREGHVTGGKFSTQVVNKKVETKVELSLEELMAKDPKAAYELMQKDPGQYNNLKQ